MTARDIINLWPSMRALADDILESHDVVRKWAQRGRIPGHADLKIIAAAGRRGFCLTHEALAGTRSRSASAPPRKGEAA